MTEPAHDQAALLDTFRDTMRHVAATVFAITAGHEGKRYGMLATAVSSLSFEPPSLLVCVNQSASMHQPMIEAGRFCVNVLATANQPVADSFTANSGEERFSVGAWDNVDGIPVLADGQSSLICRIVDQHDFGTHSILIGELTHGWHRGISSPLAYCDRRYVEIAREQVDGN